MRQHKDCNQLNLKAPYTTMDVCGYFLFVSSLLLETQLNCQKIELESNLLTV